MARDAPRIRRVWVRGIARFLAETFRQVHDPWTAAGGEYIRAPGGRLKSWIDIVVPPFDMKYLLENHGYHGFLLAIST